MIGLLNLAGRTACLAVAAIFAASPSLPIELAEQPITEKQISKDVGGSLAKMSTGVEQELLLAGGDAQSRNLLIPVSGGTPLALSAYAPIKLGSAKHSTAMKCLTQAVYYEAANESNDGKRAVAQVVLNRMRHPAYPNSVCGVVYQGVNARVCQFSFTCDGALLREPLRRQWSESEQVARAALSGSQMAAVGTATHYHADYVVPKWAYTLSKIEVIGTHIFYRFPGRAGRPSAFAARWAQSERIPDINWQRFNAAFDDAPVANLEEEAFVPGLSVTRDTTDRHADTDVGGRIDTTKQWRLSIPDPVASESSYKATLEAQTSDETPKEEASQ
uniref:cell wall hydrolase n=1 Tax=uncultured Erythrobacter sp. TaxID=263913 RepID=UPI0026296FC9|nr:cell wall hydrolase [uncultured Erythrobacter sp.]